jgi:flagellar biosynthetic protein FliR
VLDITNLTIFLLVFTRVFSFMVIAPFFALPGIPTLAKFGLSFFLAVVIYPVLPGTPVNVSGNLIGYMLALTKETITGLSLGILVNIIFSGIRNAGQYMDFQMGFGLANAVDPLTGIQGTMIGQFINLLGLVFFFNIDGHHRLINAFGNSYQLVPLNAAGFNYASGLIAAKAFAGMSLLALQISAPLLAVLIIVDLALGFVAKAAPQINVFLLGFPLKILAGLFILFIILPLLATPLTKVFSLMEKNMFYLLKGLS